MSRITHTRIESFDDVYTFVRAKNEKFTKSRQTWTNSITTLQDKVNALETELTAMRQQLIRTGGNEMTQSDLLKRTRSELNAIVTQNDHLTSELAESNRVIEKLRQALQQQKDTLSYESTQSQLQDTLTRRESVLNRERKEFRKKLLHQRRFFKTQLADALRAKETEFDAILERMRKEFEAEMRECRTRLDTEARLAKSELNEERKHFLQECNHLKDERARVEASLAESKLRYLTELNQERQNGLFLIEQREAELAQQKSFHGCKEQAIDDDQQRIELKRQIDELQDALSVKEKQCQTEEKKLSYVKLQHHEALTANTQLIRCKEELEVKVNELYDDLQAMQIKATEKYHKLITRIKRMKQLHKQEIDDLSVEIESRLIARVKIIEQDATEKERELVDMRLELEKAYFQQQQLKEKLQAKGEKMKQKLKLADTLKVENERLRNLMREKTSSSKVNEVAAAELRRLCDFLGLDSRATPEMIVDTAASALTRRKRS